MAFGDLFRSASSNINKVNSKLNNFNSKLNQAQSQLNNLQQIVSSPANQIQNIFQTKADNLLNVGKIESLTSKASSLLNNSTGDLQSQINDIIPPSFDFGNFTNPISVLSEGVGDITGKIDQLANSAAPILQQLTNLSTATSEIAEVFSSSGQTQLLGSSDFGGASIASSKLPNPLRNYSSYNYVITLACLSKSDINTPSSSYRSNGLTNVILRSSGGEIPSPRVTVAAEDIYGKNAEYYIDDLEIDSILTHNSNTGPTQGTNIMFKVIEPYSMGQFIEALQVASIQAGHKSYIEAPYCLEIKFAGWNDDGEFIPDPSIPPKYIPIQFTNVEFEVTGEGSTYSCEAIPYNEMATFDDISRINNDISARGFTVADILQNQPDNSFTKVINDRLKTQEDVGIVEQQDRYVIVFPTDKQGITKAVDSGSRTVSGPDDGLRGTSVGSGKSVYEIIKGYAASNINDIGKSRMVLDPSEEGDRPMAQADAAMDPNKLNVAVRTSENMQMANSERNYQFNTGDSIMDIISDTVIRSEYGRRISETPPQNGKKEWFIIQTQVFIENNPSSESQLGRDPKIYVYSVVPYFADATKFQGPGRRADNTQGLMNQALKTYNYLYSGTNEDVLNFNIDFKFAFFENTASDLGQLSGQTRSGAQSEMTNTGTPLATTIAPPGVGPGTVDNPNDARPPMRESSFRQYTANSSVRSSALYETKVAIAQMFHDNLVNSNTDMLQAELEIWGDPYYIPTSGMGNYNAQPAAPFLTSDGTLDYQNTEVFIIVNFRTPFDYDEETGLMTFSKIVRQFSGLYAVISVNNIFSGGQFKQVIQLNRRRSDSDEETGDTDSVRLNESTSLAEGSGNQFGGTGGPVGSTTSSGATAPGAQGDGLRGIAGSTQGTGGTGAANTNTDTDAVGQGPATGNTTPNVEYVSGFSSKIRNQPIQDRLLSILDAAAATAQVRVEITSGGQTDSRRTGSHRHDDGYAADIALYDGNDRLSLNDPEEATIIQTFLQAAKNAGATAIGAGNGYMSNQTFHVDIANGRPGVNAATYWGTPSARSAGAPSWLRAIMTG